MSKLLLLVPAVLLFGYRPALLAAPQAASSAPQASSSAKTGSETSTRAKKIYEVDCALCHGATGNGKTDLAVDMKLQLDDWTDARALASKSDQQLFSAIRNGKDKMPPEAEGRAKNDEVKAIIAYIRSMAKSATPATATDAPAPAPATPPSTN